MRSFMLSLVSVMTAAGIAVMPAPLNGAESVVPVVRVASVSTMPQEDSSFVSAPAEESNSTSSESVVPDSMSTDSSASDTESQESDVPEQSLYGLEADAAPAMMPRATSSHLTDELVQLLCSNQADSMMGSLGLVRSEDCANEVARFIVQDFHTTDDIDYNYAMLWQAVYDALGQIAKTDGAVASCLFAQGTITVLR